MLSWLAAVETAPSETPRTTSSASPALPLTWRSLRFSSTLRETQSIRLRQDSAIRASIKRSWLRASLSCASAAVARLPRSPKISCGSATVSGVCVDVYAPEAMLLRSRASTMLGPIVCKSGGRFRPCASPLCLEDNVARHVGSAYAAAGTLSVRTSCGFCAAIEESGADGLEIGASFRSDGGAWSSLHGEGEEGVQFCGLHLAGCDASMSVVLPFRMDDSVSSGQAFSSWSELKRPALQICYEFFQQEDDCVARRLRVATMRVPVAQSVRDVMLHADGSAAFLVVCRKVLSRVARARRLRLPNVDAAGLVTDWLVHLIAQYHTHVVRERPPQAPGVGASESALFAETKAGSVWRH